MSNEIWFDPTSGKLVLSDGEHYLEVPYWARGIIADEFERETEPLKTENACLWELVRDMWTCIQTADKSDNAWDECPRCSLWNGNNNHRCEFGRRMKELFDQHDWSEA